MLSKSRSQHERSRSWAAAARGADKSTAWRLGLPEDTVKANVRSILSKLDVRDRIQAVTMAFGRGIIVL